MPCVAYMQCDHRCQTGEVATLVRKAIDLDGLSLGEALRVVFTIVMGGGYPMEDPKKDAEFLNLLDGAGTIPSERKEEAFYDSIIHP